MAKPADDPAPSQTIEHEKSVARRRPRIAWNDAAGAHDVRIDRRMLVGSAPGSDVCLDDRTVSRIHAELEPHEDGLWVKDLGSRNGTYIGDVRIEMGRVPPRERIRLGGTTFVATYETEPSPVELWQDHRFGPLVGRSTVMREMFALLAKVAKADAPVLVFGETGTGKELVARALHEASNRASGPFVVVDCAALPESLLEAELFGHAKGAFTGAASARAGAIESGEGGTVFLDEIGELPLAVQPKLLRVLESREVRRIGETTHRKIDVRLVSATHRDLRRMVNANAFREDLYFRLAVLVVSVPPLRERLDDVPLLVQHLLAGHDANLDVATLKDLSAKPWLGNVRELRNFVERTRVLGVQGALAMAPSASSERAVAPPGSLADLSLEGVYKDVRELFVETFERAYFKSLLERHGRDVPEAAQAAGVDRSYVYRMIRKYYL